MSPAPLAPPDVCGSPSSIGTQTPTHRREQAVAALAHAQHGVVTVRQLQAIGLTPTMVHRRVASGRLLRLHRGVYAVGHKRLRREGYWLAAVLAVGPGAVLSHRQAAALHGFRPANGTTVDVTTNADRADQPGIRVHRARTLDPADITTVDGIPVTTPSRTLVDLAGTVPRDHLAKALREADRLQILDIGGIERTLTRTRGRRGHAHKALREALQEYATLAPHDTRSPLEDDLLRLLHGAHLPLPQTNAPLHGFVVDALWTKQRMVVELDGAGSHLTRHAFQKDRERDRALTAAGYRVLRYTHADLTRHAGRTVGELRAFLVSAAAGRP
jgi:predicted transcriptional regulator of viral defense system/very-short-patch-repair endonuclease